METTFNSQDINPTIRRLISKKAHRLVGTTGFSHDDFPDIVQDLILFFLEHQFGFDERRGSLTTFTGCILDNQIATIIEARYAAKRDVRQCRDSLDDEIESPGEAPATGHDVYDMDTYLQRTGKATRTQEELHDLSIDVAREIRKLPRKLQRIAVLLMSHRKIDAARRLKIPWSSFCDLCNQLRKIFEEKNLQEYL